MTSIMIYKNIILPIFVSNLKTLHITVCFSSDIPAMACSIGFSVQMIDFYCISRKQIYLSFGMLRKCDKAYKEASESGFVKKISFFNCM